MRCPTGRGDPAGGLTGIRSPMCLSLRDGASATQLCADTIRLGKYDIGIAVGMDKHRAARSPMTRKLALPQWYAQNGQFVTTKFFGIKANRYIHENGISQQTLARWREELPQRSSESECVPAQADFREEILGSPVLNYPLTHTCSARRRRCGGGDHVPRDIAHRFMSKRCTCGRPKFARVATAPTKCTHVCPVEEDVSPTVYASRAAFESAGVSPEDVDVIQLQDTDAGAEVIHMAEAGFLRRWRPGEAAGRRRHRDQRPDAGEHRRGLIANGEPIGASACGRCTSWCASCGVRPVIARWRGSRGRFCAGLWRTGDSRGDDPDGLSHFCREVRVCSATRRKNRAGSARCATDARIATCLTSSTTAPPAATRVSCRSVGCRSVPGVVVIHDAFGDDRRPATHHRPLRIQRVLGKSHRLSTRWSEAAVCSQYDRSLHKATGPPLTT